MRVGGLWGGVCDCGSGYPWGGRGCEVKGVGWLVGWDVSREAIQAQ